MKIAGKIFAAIASFALFANVQSMEHEKHNLGIESFKLLAVAYGSCYSATLAHELGHMAAYKLLQKNSKSLIYVDPFLKGGWHTAYQGSLTLAQKISFIALRNKGNPEGPDLLNFIKKHTIEFPPLPKGPRGAAIIAAGPLAGLGYCALLPYLNTLATEYSKTRSLQEAIQNANHKGYYVHEDQNVAIVTASIIKGIDNIINLLPLHKDSDGYRLVESLKLSKPAIRYSAMGLPWMGVGLLGYGVWNKK